VPPTPVHPQILRREPSFVGAMKRFTYEIGRALRETGTALDRAGLEAMEKPIFKEPCESLPLPKALWQESTFGQQ
jgi:hypothetical protein